jgi:hypothetical protein
MSMPKWCDLIVDDNFESSSGKTPQFKAFMSSVKKWWKAWAKEFGATELDIHEMHFEFSGFFKVGDQYWYVNCGDVRSNFMSSMLVRTAAQPKDYTGGVNQSVKYDGEFLERLNRIVGVIA